MSNQSDIQWCDSTWNPTAGCSPKSPGCAHCYAETMSRRQQAMAQADAKAGRDPGKKRFYLDVIGNNGRWNGRVNTVEEALTIPLGWKKPRKIFVNSMSDLFWGEPDDLVFARRHRVEHPEPVPFEFIDKVFAVMALCPQHTFQILTKRPKRMAEYMNRMPSKWSSLDPQAYSRNHSDELYRIAGAAKRMIENGDSWELDRWPLPNVWLGTSTENQKTADERIPWLLKCPAAVRFISAEPLLGPVNPFNSCPACHGEGSFQDSTEGGIWVRCDCRANMGLHWVITGGESGSGARPCDVAWIRSIVRQCKEAGTACFVKQLGAIPTIQCPYCKRTVGKVPSGFTDYCCKEHKQFIADLEKVKDSKGGNMSEWPEDLRVRQMPGESA